MRVLYRMSIIDITDEAVGASITAVDLETIEAMSMPLKQFKAEASEMQL